VTDRFDVVGTGSMVVDVIHLVPRIIGPEEKLLVEASGSAPIVRRLVGGVALNHLGWARLLGLRVALFGKQADDEDGRLLRSGMDRLGIEHDIDLGGSASSCADVFVDSKGERAIYMRRGATAELSPGDVERRFAGLLQRARTFTTEVSQVPLATVRRALELARAAGARTVVDLDLPVTEAVPALGSEAELWAVLELADVLKPAEVALEGLASAAEPAQAAAELAGRFGAGAVAVTLGERGALVWADGETARVPSARAGVVDTTGAGDAFLGGFVAGIHLDLDWERSAQLGNACGAACCEQVGAFPDDPERCRARVAEHLSALGGAALDLPPLEPSASEAVGGSSPLEQFLDTARSELERLTSRVRPSEIRAAARHIIAAEAAGARVHLTGVGKPEHVAHYVASLLSSTGTPATFLHGTEAAHGSVGQLRPGDVLIAISKSGETPELLAAVEAARSLGAWVLALTADARSPLGRSADQVLEARVDAEGGPLGLAPRASILAEILVLQALSVELQSAKGLTREEYHRRHPAGTLGRESAPR
jgi:arabinose-5-phosphate isomerase